MTDRTLTIERAGTTLTVRVAGDGPPMLYLHGLTGLSKIARLEAPTGYTLATYDQRGHGDSRGTWTAADFRVEDFIADLLAVLDALGWERPVLGGMSMGSTVALSFALAHPDRVGRLLLVAPAFGDAPHPAGEIFDLMAGGLRTAPMVELIPLVRQRQQERGLPEEATAWLEEWTAHEPLALATAVEVVSRWIPFPDWQPIRDLTVPAVVVAWEQDPVHPWSTAVQWADALGAPLHELPGLANAVSDPSNLCAALTRALQAGTP